MILGDERNIFLSTMKATRGDRMAALTVVGVSAVLFACAVPFAGVPLAPVPAFVASYQSALAINDLITAVLLFSQFAISRSRGLLLLASGYLFTAMAAIVHALTFPGLFAPGGLLGAGTQTTVWLYMVWHGVFPLLVLGYALLKATDNDKMRSSTGAAVVASIVAVSVAMAAFTWLVTVQHDRLPILLSGGHYTPIMLGVVSTVWCLSFAALLVLWLRRPHFVLDVWLMVVMCAWLFDIALSAILNVARFDVGFYLGRIYGLCAASFVLAVLLVDNVGLQAKLARLLGTSRTESKRTEQALDQEMEERRRIFESSNDLILVSDSAGNLIQVSPSVSDILGYQPSEMVGHNAIKFIHPDDLEHTRKEMRAGRRGQSKRNFETRYISKEGKSVALNWTGTWSEPVRRHFFIGRDLTEKQAAEAQLRHVQKMDAVGQLTGGVAHDFNNILTVITGTIGILEEAVADQPQLAAVAKLIDEAAERGANLTKHLLAFARKQPLQPVEVDVNALVLEAAKLLHPTLGEHIEITPLLAEDAWTALVDPNQLSTAVLNLAINARDAMPNGGKLALETSNVVLDESYAGMHSEVTPGHYVMIAVSDTGSGIPPALLERVFEPFFTTKEVGRGTGLGLSMVFGFVKQSGGHVKIYSEQGHGTTVRVYLPRAAGLQQTAAEAVSANIEGGSETVLVVEDDALVRRYVIAQIESLGYATLEAANASDALRIIDEAPTIDLLFTDVIMPGTMNGRQLVDEALKRRPDLKTLYTSGYTENAIVHHGRLDSGVLLLAKPYRKSELARMIRLALAS
ncbi:hybrid sensor histidine kinase/response regulator [Bradyrhizobium icense]|uniref:histidine kinase n=2 Tax=Bradyrhizobium icense TaxID=1274631 RepID=A0A1B1USJ2_9BRAD|nr:hybrid sensor histidine kinase/response regulator [Bradyrhizobium icense]